MTPAHINRAINDLIQRLTSTQEAVYYNIPNATRESLEDTAQRLAELIQQLPRLAEQFPHLTNQENQPQ